MRHPYLPPQTSSQRPHHFLVPHLPTCSTRPAPSPISENAISWRSTRYAQDAFIEATLTVYACPNIFAPRRVPRFIPIQNRHPHLQNPTTPRTPRTLRHRQKFPKPKSAFIPLSPYVSNYAYYPNMENFSTAQSSEPRGIDKFLTALGLELCLADQPAYTDCSNNAPLSTNFFRNASVNLDKNRKDLAWLKRSPSSQGAATCHRLSFETFINVRRSGGRTISLLLQLGFRCPEKNERGSRRIIGLLQNVRKDKRGDIE